MPVTTTYTEAREKLAEFWDRAVQDREIIRITRRGKDDVVLIAADEVESLLETAYLFRSPRNAERLLRALDHALRRTEQPETVDDLRRELGVEPATEDVRSAEAS